MQSFEEILDIARQRHGDTASHGYHGAASPKSPEELAAIPDDRYLSMATRCIFQSGFSWKVVDAKWEGFETAFDGFNLARWVMSNDDDIAELLSDTRIIRNGMKIRTVPENARYFAERSKEFGGVGKWIGNWPVDDQIGLMADMAKNGSRLGAMTGQYFLRFMGKDSFDLSRDVMAALVRAGVIDKPATSKTAMLKIQAAFNQWREEIGLPMTAISQTLGKSIDA